MSDSRRSRCRKDGLHIKAGDTKDREICRRIPARKFGFQHAPVMPSDMQAVFTAQRLDGREDHVIRVHETAGGTPPPLHLDDGEGRGSDRISHLSRKFIQHATILSEIRTRRITRTGSAAPGWGTPTIVVF